MSGTTRADFGRRSRARVEGPARAAARTVALASLCGFACHALAQSDSGGAAPEIGVLPVQGNIYMLVGPESNVTIQVGNEGVLVVDAMGTAMAETLLAAIQEITDKPITFVVNTHAHPDNVGGNAVLAEAGSNIAGGNVVGTIADAGATARIVAHENALIAITAMEDLLPFEGWPTDTYFTGHKDLFFNGEAVRVLHQPAAHTDGDSIVFFRRSDVIATGDIFLTTTYPYIDRAAGGSFQGIIDSLNRILDLAVPADRQEGGTMIIPGQGRLSDEADVLEYRDMLTIIRDRIRYLVDQGMSLDEVLDAHPTLDYDGRYGADSGPWTTEQFIEAVYEELRESAGTAAG